MKAGDDPLDKANFVSAALAGVVTVLIFHPFDFLKNRMQVNTRARMTSYRTFKRILKREGPFCMYNGISAGLLKQATLKTSRVGFYHWQCDAIAECDGRPLSFGYRAIVGLASGIMGAVIATPAELALTRMTTDGSLPRSDRRNYKNVIHAFFRIIRQEGFTKLWLGAVPTMVRSLAMTTIQMTTYAKAKKELMDRHICTYEDNVCKMTSAIMSGIMTTIFSLPTDILKTRIQSATMVDGKSPRTGMYKVLVQIIKKEGIVSLWKGFTPYFIRSVPHTALTMLLYERFQNAYKFYIIDQKETKKNSKHSSLKK